MIFKSFLMMIAGVCLAGAAENVALSGTVTENGGTTVAGAAVTLAMQPGLKATTDAEGKFTLSGPVGVIEPASALLRESIGLDGKESSIRFSLVSPVGSATMAVHAGNGRRVSLSTLGKLQTGTHVIPLPELAPGYYVVRLTLGGSQTILKLISTGNGAFLSRGGHSSGTSVVLSKKAAAAAVDTLVVSKTGYTTAKQALSTYTKSDIAVVLVKAEATVCPELKLPAISAITYSNKKHPDAFTFKYMDMPGKVTTLAQWECRRQEILQMAQDYLYGHMPPKCDVVGTVSGGTITAKCSYNGKTTNVSLTASGSGDILMIDFGMGAPKPANARSASASGATFLSAAKSLYGSTDMGICMASAWGVGRIIDALEQNPDGGISAEKVVVTGCSTNGKQAMGAGVFEPRVALCVPVESGAGGTCSWRVSSEYGHGNSNTDCQDITHLETNWTGTVTDNTWEKGNPTIDHLPFDQGELMALRAPGAFLQVDNGKEQYRWLCNRGNTAAAQACHWIYKALGVEDHFGFIQPDPGHTHCSWPTAITPDLTRFYDKFLNGKTDVDTHVFTYNKESMETAKWFEFGTGDDQWDTTLVLE